MLKSDQRVFLELVRREIRSRYVGTRFGLVWTVLNPAIQLLSYSVIFGYLYSDAGESGSRLVASLFCGLWPWWTFQEGFVRGMSALVDQADLLRRIPLRPELCVAASVTASVFLQSIGFLLFLLVFGAVGIVRPGIGWLALAAWMPMGLLLTTGLALAVAPLYTVIRDVLYVVNATLTVGFFASPVLYEVASLPRPLATFALLNPMASLIGLYREAVLGGGPAATGSAASLTLGVVGSWLLARWVFSRARGRLDEFL